MNRSAVTLFALSLSLCSLAGCSDPVTQLVVVVDTDMMVPEQIDSIRINTMRASSDVVERFDFQIYDVDASSMPLTVGVLVPEALQNEEGGPLEDPQPIAIEVDATGGSDRDRVVTRVEAEFVEGLSLELPIFVGSVCRRTMCPMGWSCGQDGCVPIAELTPDELALWEGDPEAIPTIPPAPEMPTE